MKVVILCTLFVIFSFAAAEQYSEKYDNIKLDEVLQNKRLLKRYIDCVMGDKRRCDREGTYLAEKLPEAIRTDCVYCTDKQKIGAFKAIHYLIHEEDESWLRIQTEFDPDNKFCVRNKEKLDYVQSHPDDFDDSEFLKFFE